jgi:hypothetical protein
LRGTTQVNCSDALVVIQIRLNSDRTLRPVFLMQEFNFRIMYMKPLKVARIVEFFVWALNGLLLHVEWSF